jgi:hypothetical protein
MTQSQIGRHETEPQPDMADVLARARRIRRNHRIGTGLGALALVAIAFPVVDALGAGRTAVTVEQVPAAEPDRAPMRYDQLLLDALGPDFRLAQPADYEHDGVMSCPCDVVVREGSAAADALPKGWTAGADLRLFPPDDEVTLSALCKPSQEKGLVQQACEPVTLPDDRTVYVQKVFLQNPTFAPGRGTNFYFGRSDGSIVRIVFTAKGPMGAGEAAHAKAADWLTGYQDTLAEAASDGRVEPRPTSTGRTPEAPNVDSHDRDLVILQQALGIDFELLDGRLLLEPNWPLYKTLPSLLHGSWNVVGDITSIDRSAFDAACAAKPGAAACEKRTVDGTEVYVRTWADQDAKDEFVGEGAAYFTRPDGRVVLGSLELTSDQLDPSRSSAKVAAVEQWLDALVPSLIKAVTDPDVKG